MMVVDIEPAVQSVPFLRLQGRLDAAAAPGLLARLNGAISDGQRQLVVDLADVPFIDSTGLGSLVSGLKATRLAGGVLRLARPGEQARTILQLTTLDRVLKPYATTEEALAGY